MAWVEHLTKEGGVRGRLWTTPIQAEPRVALIMCEIQDIHGNEVLFTGHVSTPDAKFHPTEVKTIAAMCNAIRAAIKGTAAPREVINTDGLAIEGFDDVPEAVVEVDRTSLPVFLELYVRRVVEEVSGDAKNKSECVRLQEAMSAIEAARTVGAVQA